ncbi:MAG: hypothetical protein AB1404_09430 [Spirochaetota bacterium]
MTQQAAHPEGRQEGGLKNGGEGWLGNSPWARAPWLFPGQDPQY